MSYYRETGKDRATYRDLCLACIRNKNVVQLEALITARRIDNADDPHLLAWDLDALWLKKDYPETLKLIDQHRSGVFDLQRYRWKSDGYYIRSLVKLGRAADAIKEAESLSKDKRISPVLLILAHAAKGDAKQTIDVVDRFPEVDYLVEDCYRDEELGPILRSVPFEAFRARFPVPNFLCLRAKRMVNVISNLATLPPNCR